MGLNWSRGLEAFGEGLGDVAKARHMSDELEYRNTRDANLRRFELEDQTRADRLLQEKRDYDQTVLDGTHAREDTQRAEDQGREDENLGISDTERGRAVKEKELSDTQREQANELEKIKARGEAQRRATAAKSELTREEWVQEQYELIKKNYLEGVDTSVFETDEEGNTEGMATLPQWRMKWIIEDLGKEYDEIHGTAAKPSAAGGGSPFQPDEEGGDVLNLFPEG